MSQNVFIVGPIINLIGHVITVKLNFCKLCEISHFKVCVFLSERINVLMKNMGGTS